MTPLPVGLLQQAGAGYSQVAPPHSAVDGGYNWGQRRFQEPAQNTMVPPNMKQPMISPTSPVPTQNAPTLAQMRQAMTQLHMVQMMNRLQRHAVTHGNYQP